MQSRAAPAPGLRASACPPSVLNGGVRPGRGAFRCLWGVFSTRGTYYKAVRLRELGALHKQEKITLYVYIIEYNTYNVIFCCRKKNCRNRFFIAHGIGVGGVRKRLRRRRRVAQQRWYFGHRAALSSCIRAGRRPRAAGARGRLGNAIIAALPPLPRKVAAQDSGVGDSGQHEAPPLCGVLQLPSRWTPSACGRRQCNYCSLAASHAQGRRARWRGRRQRTARGATALYLLACGFAALISGDPAAGLRLAVSRPCSNLPAGNRQRWIHVWPQCWCE